MRPLSNRRLLLLAAAICALALPRPASAHSRSRPVALDFTLKLGTAPPGVHAAVLDGERSLRLRVDPGTRVVVPGALYEPMLRFDRDGVWANRNSLTAAADRIVRAGKGWTLLTRAHSFRWHDHRLVAPQGLRPGQSAPWSLKFTADGHPAALVGTYTRAPRPLVWPWLVGAGAVLAVLAECARRRPRGRARLAAIITLGAAVGALVDAASFSAWLQVVLVALLVLAAARANLRTPGRGIIAGVVGAGAAAIGLGYLAVFHHGVVLSSLPPAVARLATAVALVGGATAIVLGVGASEPRPEEVSPVGSDIRPQL
jgi:hypothetical protein